MVKFNPLKVNVITEIKTEGPAAGGCQWKVGSTDDYHTDLCSNVAPATWKDEKPESCKGTKPALETGKVVLCCCPPCPTECQAVGCNYCTACKEDCVILTIPTKPGNGTKLSAPLAQKLASAYSQKNNWRVTEAWPPSQGHKAICHTNGTCSDINFIDGSKDPTRVKELYDILVAAGLSATYEAPDCSIYPGVNCGGGSEFTNAEHFHVN